MGASGMRVVAPGARRWRGSALGHSPLELRRSSSPVAVPCLASGFATIRAPSYSVLATAVSSSTAWAKSAYTRTSVRNAEMKLDQVEKDAELTRPDNVSELALYKSQTEQA